MFSKISNQVRLLSSRVVSMVLHPIECALSDSSAHPLQYAPVFIIGAPRSGSTLLFQAMTDYFDFGYLTNFHCLFYGGPSLVHRFLPRVRDHQSSSYQSTYGRIAGWRAPSECGKFWYRFFRRKPHYVPIEVVPARTLAQLRGVIRSLGNTYRKPVLFKNLNSTLRLMPLATALPEAVFIVVQRNEINNASSLLTGRKVIRGNYDTWLAMEPPRIKELKSLPPHQQVIEQVRHIYSLIEDHKSIIGPERFFHVNYENFCSDTHAVLDAMQQFLSTHGIHVERRGDVPTSFKQSSGHTIEPDLYQRLVEYAQQSN